MDGGEDRWLSGVCVLVIEEASMVGSIQMAELLEADQDRCEPILRRIGMHGELRIGPPCLGAFLQRVPVAGFAQDGHVTTLGLDEYLGQPCDPSAWRSFLVIAGFGSAGHGRADAGMIDAAPQALLIDLNISAYRLAHIVLN